MIATAVWAQKPSGWRVARSLNCRTHIATASCRPFRCSAPAAPRCRTFAPWPACSSGHSELLQNRKRSPQERRVHVEAPQLGQLDAESSQSNNELLLPLVWADV